MRIWLTRSAVVMELGYPITTGETSKTHLNANVGVLDSTKILLSFRPFVCPRESALKAPLAHVPRPVASVLDLSFPAQTAFGRIETRIVTILGAGQRGLNLPKTVASNVKVRVSQRWP